MSQPTPTGQLAIPLDRAIPLDGSGEPLPRGLTEGPSPDGPSDGASLGRLTDEQEQAAARRQGSLLLAAGAGSGKTSVLVERFVRAVLEDGLAPGRILAITFTERAAGELRERVRARFVALDRRQEARDTEAAFVGTFHGFCARLLLTHPVQAGLDPELAILDEGQAGRLRLEAFRGALGDFLTRQGGPAVDLVAAFGADRLRGSILGAHAQLRSQGQAQPRLLGEGRSGPLGRDQLRLSGKDVPGLLDRSGSLDRSGLLDRPGPLGEDRPRLLDRASAALSASDQEGARACLLLDGLLQGFSERYSQLKSRRGGLDFDDLELHAGRLLEEHPDVRANWSQRFELLMVDEFQDTNPRQLALLRALERDNLFTVGDELQSIYGFRHADPGLFRARRAQLAQRGAALALTRNFRSRPTLLAVIDAVFAARFGEGHTPLVAGRPEEGRGAAAGGPVVAAPSAPAGPADHGGAESPGTDRVSIELLLTDRGTWNGNGGEGAPAIDVSGQLPPAPRWRHAEARLLAQRIAELVDAGQTDAGDVAVLLRALGDLPVYQRAIEERGLSTLAAVGSFWGHQQVGDLLAYLRVLANPLDDLALYSTLASPLVGVSSDGLAHLARVAQSEGHDVWETLQRLPQALRQRLDHRDLTRLAGFAERFAAERPLVCVLPIDQLLRRLIDFADYRSHLLALPWGQRRLANVHKLLRLARRFEDQEGRDLRGFLDHVAHHRDPQVGLAEPEAPVTDGEANAVRLMSVHAAKGLEFPVVCLADLGRAPKTLAPDLLLDGTRLGLRLPRLDGSEAVPTLDYAELLQERRHAEAAEEDRIVYVAATRARERLLLSGGVDFASWPRDRLGAAPIAWLAPLLLADLPALLSEAVAPIQELPVSGLPHVRLRLALNSPATFGAVLREDSLRPPPASVPDRPSESHASPPVPDPPSESHASPPVPDPPPESHASPPVPDPPPEDHASPPVPDRPREDHARTLPLQEKPALALSYTSISELERCGYRYYLERVLRLPEDHSLGSGRGGRQRGILVHRIMQALDFAAPDLDAIAAEAGPAQQCQEIVRLVQNALATPLARRLAVAPALREHPFAFSLAPAQPLLTGVIDLLVRDPSGDHLVVDYKSDRLVPQDDLQAVVERSYSAQRLVYALAALHDHARRVEVVHWFLARPQEPVVAVYTAADRPQLERELLDRVQRVRAAGFAVSPAPHRDLCLTCPGRATLCSWEDPDTLRPV